MAKFLFISNSDTYINLDHVVSITYEEHSHKEYDEIMGKWIIITIFQDKHELLGFLCKKNELTNRYKFYQAKILEMIK